MKKLLTLILLSATTMAFGANYYAGGSVGYLVDSQDAYFSARIGLDVAKVNTLTHSVEFEAGATSDKEAGFKLEIYPVMANYRLTAPLGQSKFSLFGGAGAGAARAKLTGWGYNDSSWAFAAQAFAGVEYNVTPTVALTAGGRYLWIGEVTLANVSDDLGDDVSWEVGVRVRF